MSLEILISKYIDGELTREEDISLRSLLKENPSAKQKFDNSVELHLEMLDDADNIKVPVDLLRKTEDRIMMEIFKSAPVTPVYKINNTKKIKKFELNLSSVAVAIIIFFFVGVLSIRDSNFLKLNNFADNSPKVSHKIELNESNESNSKNSNLRKVKGIQPKSENMNSSEQVIITTEPQLSYNDSYIDAGSNETKSIDFNEGNAVLNVDLNNKAKEISPVDKENTTKNLKSDIYINTTPKSNSNVNYSSIGNIPMSYLERFPTEIREIHITSFVSQDFIRTNIKTHDNTSIMNYSQSISYAVNENSRLGLEFGMTKFSYDVNKMVKLSNITASGKSNIEVLDPTGDGTSLTIPVKMEEQEQLYWGSVFFEHTLFSFANFSLLGRAGIGASNDGALGYGLIMANYSIINGIYLTVGTEGRLFKTQIPSLGNNSLSSSISIIYGLHFQF